MDGHPTLLELAEAGYRGYAAHTGGKTFDGRDMPEWPHLPERTVQAWAAAVEAIQRALPAPKRLDIVFERLVNDLAFVEVERDGRSVTVGEWVDRDDGFVVLRIQAGEQR